MLTRILEVHNFLISVKVNMLNLSQGPLNMCRTAYHHNGKATDNVGIKGCFFFPTALAIDYQ